MIFKLQKGQHAARARSLANVAFYASGIAVFTVLPGFAQKAGTQPERKPTALVDLLNEAEHNNPQIQSARDSWRAARQIPEQVSALPEPQVQVQQLDVGSLRPFAGYGSSNFAYVGLGVSQDLPYPGKLKLRGEVAKRDADIADNHSDSVSRAVLGEVKAAYFQLGYLSETLNVLSDDQQLLRQVEQAAEARYRSGVGNQQDVLQAQIEETKLLRDISMQHLETGKVQARLKQLLNRTQSSPDIETYPLTETSLSTSFEDLLSAAQAQNPDIAGAQNMIERQKLQVDAAHKDFYPDFNIQYMFQRTDPSHFPAYNMVTLGVKVPLDYSKHRSELAQAEAALDQSRRASQAQLQQVAADVRQQYLIAQQTADVLKIYREGLIPEARTNIQAGLAAYQNNRQEFQPLLNSYLDILRLEQEDWQNVADHETAIARLEQITGLSLRPAGAATGSKP